MSDTPSSQQTALEAAGLVKRFGAATVLKDVSLAAADGETIAIIGPSGSGKSTFLRCLNLLEAPDEGRISLGGDDIIVNGARPKESHLARFRARIGFVFQQFNLWPNRTALENVALAPMQVKGFSRSDAEEIAAALLARVGLADHAKKYPAQMSGGQQQRCAIARALAMEPEVILFDEATSALDPELVGEVLAVIRGLAEEGRTMVLVTHEMAFARDVADRVVFMDGGTIVEAGAAAEIMDAPRSDRLRQFLAATVRGQG